MRLLKAIKTIGVRILVVVAVGMNVIFLPAKVQAGSGDLDSSFGLAGFMIGGVRTFTLTAKFRPCCIAQQPDGKLLVAGMVGGSNVYNSYDGRLVLRRHLVTSGSLDSTFGMGGEAVAIGPYPASFVWGLPMSMTVQPDGKILVAGKRADGKPVLWRFTTAGQLDTAFGAEGIQVLSTLEGSANGVTLYNEKILTVESFLSSTDYLLRRNSNGSPDSTIGLFGFVALPAAAPRGVAVDPVDGSMYVVFGDTSYQGFVCRILANGLVDTAFGDGGLITIPFNDCGFHTLSEVEVQADAKILVVGFNGEPPWGRCSYIFRFSNTGEPDSSFGTAGRLALQHSQNAVSPSAPHIARQADGKIVALAFDTAYPSLKRINADSSTDTTFDPTYTTNSFSFDVLVQSGDGKVLVLATPADLDADSYKLIRFMP